MPFSTQRSLEPTQSASPPLSQRLVWTMAVTSGAAAANLYYNQPLLVAIAESFQAPHHATAWIPMLTQIGYALGIFFIVPLGDLNERRGLILRMLVATAITLVAAAVAPNLTWLIAASLAIGMMTIVAQLVVPLAAQLATPQTRGRVVGSVMSGLLIGILAARTISGFVGAQFGWRTMYWLASAGMLGLAAVLSRSLPKSQPELRVPYRQLMGSLIELIRSQPVLRETSLVGALSFGAFSAFWSTLVFLLAGDPFHYGSEVAGSFGLVGIVGAAAAPAVGKLADRRDPKYTVGLGLATSCLSFLIFWLGGHSLIGLLLGVVLLDLGVQTTMVSNQARIYRLPPEFHSRLNAVYITFYFGGGAVGSFLGAYGWSHWQWNGVCAVALLMLSAAFTTFLKQKRPFLPPQ